MIFLAALTLLLSSTTLVWSQSDILPEPSSSMQEMMSSSVPSSDLIVSTSPTISTEATIHLPSSISFISHSSTLQAVTTTSSSSYIIMMPPSLAVSSSSSSASSSSSPSVVTSSATTIAAQTTTPSPLESSSAAKGGFLSEIKYIYIIIGIILFLILIIILLIAVVAIMCQRRIFDKKEKKRKRAKKASRQQSPLTSVEVHKPQPQTPVASPAQKSPKKATKPIDSVKRNGVCKDDKSPMSDFPLLCRVLQDYDSAQYRQTSVSSGDALVTTASPVRTNEATSTTSHQSKPIASSTNNKLVSPLYHPDDVFISTKQVNPVAAAKRRLRASSDSSSEFEASWGGKSTTVSYVSGCRDSHDYDELESMIEHLKKKSGSPPRSPPKVPLKIFGGVSVLPVPFNTSPSVPMSNGTPMRKESMKRSLSADGIFDDPKYTRLSVGSSNSVQPMAVTVPSHEIYDHLGTPGIRESKNAKEPLRMKRSLSTSATKDMSIDRHGDYKEYMSLQQLLDIMEAKIPSREASEETEDREDQLYCPRVLRPVQV